MNDTESKRKSWLMGCGIAGLGAVLVPVGLYAGWSACVDQQEAEALAAQRAKAEAVFEPAVEKLEEAKAAESYDIDATIRVIHGIDRALESGALAATVIRQGLAMRLAPAALSERYQQRLAVRVRGWQQQWQALALESMNDTALIKALSRPR